MGSTSWSSARKPGQGNMSKKKVKTVIKLQLQAGKATPAPSVGTALGPHGLNIMEFCKETRSRKHEQEESQDRHQAAAPGRQGDPCAVGRHGPGSAWAQHHGVLQGNQVKET